MKDIRFHISLYVIVPVIFTGISVLSSLLTYRLTMIYLDMNQPPGWPVAFWGALLALFTLVSGLLIVKFLLDPVKRFVDRTRQMGVIEPEQEPDGSMDDMARFNRVFEQVTELLSRVEAQRLFPEMVGQSRLMRGVFKQITKVAPTGTTVLIQGETGTGKELVARSIHRLSPRRKGPFVAINCAAIPEGLLESELFGHEKGAFTGAHKRKTGKMEAASGGTLFLDEIGDMPAEIQAKVLRAIEERQVEPVGSMRKVAVDVRIIAASNKDLATLVRKGVFRKDLYYRLNVVTIYLPPLRLRRDDIPPLAERFIEEQRADVRIAPDALDALLVYPWPGNVRELRNAMESAVLMADERIELRHLPPAVIAHRAVDGALPAAAAAATAVDLDEAVIPEEPVVTKGRHMNIEPSVFPTPAGTDEATSLDEALGNWERHLIIQALKQCNGVQAKAARMLGIKERSLWHRVRKYGIDPKAYRAPPSKNEDEAGKEPTDFVD